MPRNHKKKKKNTPKEKVVYYDDNSTIADMSNVTAPGERRRDKNPKPRSTAKEKWKTYWSTVKKMIGPMLIVLAVMTAVFGIIMLISVYGM
ncbi:MAG: hypothetical protein K2L02_05230 [Clostridia bacterium]|nr:hypothetical protein [Clostridia bacterium]